MPGQKGAIDKHALLADPAVLKALMHPVRIGAGWQSCCELRTRPAYAVNDRSSVTAAIGRVNYNQRVMPAFAEAHG